MLHKERKKKKKIIKGNHDKTCLPRSKGRIKNWKSKKEF